jgi:hypothetical protein
MVDLNRDRAASPVLADQADRSQLQATQVADQRRIGPIEPRRDELAMQHGRVHVRVMVEARLEVAAERLQTLGAGSRCGPAPAR